MENFFGPPSPSCAPGSGSYAPGSGCSGADQKKVVRISPLLALSIRSWERWGDKKKCPHFPAVRDPGIPRFPIPGFRPSRSQILGFRDPGIPRFQIPGFRDSQIPDPRIPRSRDSQIPRSRDSQIPGYTSSVVPTTMRGSHHDSSSLGFLNPKSICVG